MKPKCKEPWKVLKLNLTIQFDENCEIFDININDGYKSISADCLLKLSEIIEEFDY